MHIWNWLFLIVQYWQKGDVFLFVIKKFKINANVLCPIDLKKMHRIYSTNNNLEVMFQPVISNNGLLTTVAFKMGPHADPIYALEGSVAVAGSVAKWLVENLNIVDSINSIMEKANSVDSTNGVHFVSAFSGLYAPYWKSDARGLVNLFLLNF